MLKSPLITPYNRTSAELMRALLSSMQPRALLPVGRLAYVSSEIPDDRYPEKAVATYQDSLKRDQNEYKIAYTRVSLNRYAILYPPHLLYIPWDSAIAIDESYVFQYLLENLNILLTTEESTIDIGDIQEDDGARPITITPIADHPLWYETLVLKAVPSNDIRSLITQRWYPALDPTEPF